MLKNYTHSVHCILERVKKKKKFPIHSVDRRTRITPTGAPVGVAYWDFSSSELREREGDLSGTVEDRELIERGYIYIHTDRHRTSI